MKEKQVILRVEETGRSFAFFADFPHGEKAFVVPPRVSECSQSLGCTPEPTHVKGLRLFANPLCVSELRSQQGEFLAAT